MRYTGIPGPTTSHITPIAMSKPRIEELPEEEEKKVAEVEDAESSSDSEEVTTYTAAPYYSP